MNELNEVKQWAESRIKSGHYPDSTGRFRLNALELFEKVLGDDEPRTPKYILDNLDSITNREATLNKRSGDTPRTYRSRVKGLLEDYVAWKADPTGFKIDRSSPRKPKEPSEAAKSVPKNAQRPEEPSQFESIRLDGGRVFRFLADDLNQKDVARIAYTLLARATDFDPSVGINLGRKSDTSPMNSDHSLSP